MELYRKIIIKSEDDLPKEAGEYFVHRKIAEKLTSFVRFAGDDIEYENKIWIRSVDWYLLPIEQEPPKEVNCPIDTEKGCPYLFNHSTDCRNCEFSWDCRREENKELLNTEEEILNKDFDIVDILNEFTNTDQDWLNGMGFTKFIDPMDYHKIATKINAQFITQRQVSNGDSESALNEYAKKCKEDFTKPSGIAMGWRACYEWMLGKNTEQRQVTDDIKDINFIKWYSGMDEVKIRNAYKRYTNEKT